MRVPVLFAVASCWASAQAFGWWGGRGDAVLEEAPSGARQAQNDTEVDELQGTVNQLMSTGLARYREKDFEGALALIDRAVGLRPEDPDLRAYKANALFRAGQPAAAIDEFKEAIAMQADQARFWSNLGSVYFYQKNYEKAIDCYKTAHELAPEDGTFQKNMDTTAIYIRMREMERELEGQQPMEIIPAAFRGFNYTHQLEATFRMLLHERPDLLDKCIEALRDAVVAEMTDNGVALAATEHLLADSLYTFSEAIGGNPDILKSAEEILRRSIFNDDLSSCSDDGHGDNVRPLGISNDTRLHVVAVATAQRHELTNLQLSVEAAGLGPLHVLGLGQKWEGLGSKVSMLLDFLQGRPQGDVVLFVDAFDVLLLPTAGKLLDLMSASPFNASAIVLSGELASSPDISLRLLYPHGPEDVPLPFLNSGSYVGYVGAVRWMLRDIQRDIRLHHAQHSASPHALDDQRWFHRFYLRHHSTLPIALDTAGLAFHTLHDVDASKLIPIKEPLGALYSTITKTVPLLIHGNGNGLTPFQEISAKLRAIGWPPGAVDSGTSSQLLDV